MMSSKRSAERAEQPPPAPAVAPRGRAAVSSTERQAAAPRRRRAGGRVLTSGQRQRQPVRVEVEAPRERRVDGQRVERRALVVEQPRQRQLAAARPAAERVGGLEHRDVDALGGEREGGSEPVGPAADDDRAWSCRHLATVAARTPVDG